MSNSTDNRRNALVEARVVEAQEWAYARWMERVSYRQMRALGCRPREAGGLGRDMSPEAYRHLVQQARESAGDLTMSREDRLERMNAENDELARHLRKRIVEAAEPDDYGVTGVDYSAIKLLLEVQKREADLNGVDAARKVDVEVTATTVLDAEIDAMLERMGAEPIESEAHN